MGTQAGVSPLLAGAPATRDADPPTAPRAAPTARGRGVHTAPLIQLVETVPVESPLGNRALPAAHDVWLAMIRSATRSLDFEQFYLSDWPGEPMHDVLEAIGAAAKRGVRVRLLLDARMHATYPNPADSLGGVPGIAVRVIDIGRIAGGVQHSKFFLVDDREVYLGSQNFDWRSLSHIHELGVRVRDARVTGAFRPVFDMDWAAAVAPAALERDTTRRERSVLRTIAPAPPPPAPAPISVAQAPGDTAWVWPSVSPLGHLPDTTRWDRDAVVRLIDSARGELIAQTLTYAVAERGLEDRALDDALRRAAARGVRVRLIVSDWEADNPRIKALQDLARVPNIEARLSTVPPWSHGYIPFARVEHCKYAVADSARVWVGTSNWEPSYFHTSRNLAVTIENPTIARQAHAIFETSWRAPGTATINPDSTYAPKIHGMTPPAGQNAYGR